MSRKRNRGRSKPKVSDLSRTPPTREEIEALVEVLDTHSLHPVSAAILGAVLVEHELDGELQDHLPHKDKTVWAELTKEVGPLRTFSQKIVMGYALRIYNNDFRSNLDIVRTIRNQFAHSKRILSFDNPLIVQELAAIKPIRGFSKDFKKYVRTNPHDNQGRYLSLCVLLTCGLMNKGTTRIRAQAKRINKKAEGYHKLISRAIDAGLLGQQQSPPGLIPVNALAGQIGHPTSSTAREALHVPRRKEEEGQ